MDIFMQLCWPFWTELTLPSVVTLHFIWWQAVSVISTSGETGPNLSPVFTSASSDRQVLMTCRVHHPSSYRPQCICDSVYCCVCRSLTQFICTLTWLCPNSCSSCCACGTTMSPFCACLVLLRWRLGTFSFFLYES